MSSSGSQNQRKERSLQAQGSRSKPLSLGQSRRRMSKYSREPESDQANAQTSGNSGAYAGTFSQSSQVRFSPSLRDISSSVSALNAGLGRISSAPILRSILSSYSFPVRPTDQQPPPGPSDSLTDEFCSSSDALMLPETPVMDTGGSVDVNPWGSLDPNILALFTTGTSASPSLNAVPDNMQSTMNTQAPSHVAASEQFRSSDLVDHPATSEYAGCSVPRPFPPAGVVNPGDPQNGPQFQGYWRPQAQVQPYSAPSLPYNPPFGPSPEAVSTSGVTTSGQPTNQNELQGDTSLSSSGDGIRLERPLRPVDGTVVELRRDTCVKIRFDMDEISRSTSTEYAGLKIPCTLSVKNRENTSEHKLLGLQILVFGTVSGLQYESICGDCKKKENRPGSLSLIDFHSKSDVVLPLRNNDDRSICISFTFHCYPKHYNNNDSEYRLEVLLCDQEQQASPIVRFRLPYTFNIVAKRTRDQLELEDGDNLPAAPRRNTRRKIPHDNGSATSCSTQGQLSSGSSGNLDNTGSVPSQTINTALPPTSIQDRVSPVPHAESSRSIRVSAPSATVEENIDGQDAVIEGTNPGRGPTMGGVEIWIYGSNLPDGSRPLYARFGENVTRVNILQPGLLSCKLPSRRDPGKVPVWLSRGPTANALPFGESLCEFEYYKPLNEIVSTLVRILEVPNPQQAAVLEVLMKAATSSAQEDGDRGQSDQRGGMSDNDIERAIIHALEPLQKMAKLDELVSMTNDYNQTLAHFAGLSGYFKLLKQLVEWNTDLTVADVNGLTPLHCAYRGGCRACVELLLDAGASETVLDALGRTPAGLLSDKLEFLIDALSLDDSTEDSIDGKSESNSGTGARPEQSDEGCYSGNDFSDHGEASQEAVGIQGDPYHEQEVTDPPPNESESEFAYKPGLDITPMAYNGPSIGKYTSEFGAIPTGVPDWDHYGNHIRSTPNNRPQTSSDGWPRNPPAYLLRHAQSSHGRFFDPPPAYCSPLSDEPGMMEGPTSVQARTNARNVPSLELLGTASQLWSRSLLWEMGGPVSSYRTLPLSPPGRGKNKHVPSPAAPGATSPHLLHDRVPKSHESHETNGPGESPISNSPLNPTRPDTIDDRPEITAPQSSRFKPLKDLFVKRSRLDKPPPRPQRRPVSRKGSPQQGP